VIEMVVGLTFFWNEKRKKNIICQKWDLNPKPFIFLKSCCSCQKTGQGKSGLITAMVLFASGLITGPALYFFV